MTSRRRNRVANEMRGLSVGRLSVSPQEAESKLESRDRRIPPATTIQHGEQAAALGIGIARDATGRRRAAARLQDAVQFGHARHDVRAEEAQATCRRTSRAL
jgi:hypothetical protein